MTTVEEKILSLDSFEPSGQEVEDATALEELLSGLPGSPGSAAAAPAIFAPMERHPEAEFGSPGPLVHVLEAMGGYGDPLRASLRRRPAPLSLWMVNRLLDAALPDDARDGWLAALDAAAVHPLASDVVRQQALDHLARQASRAP